MTQLRLAVTYIKLVVPQVGPRGSANLKSNLRFAAFMHFTFFEATNNPTNLVIKSLTHPFRQIKHPGRYRLFGDCVLFVCLFVYIYDNVLICRQVGID